MEERSATPAQQEFPQLQRSGDVQSHDLID